MDLTWDRVAFNHLLRGVDLTGLPTIGELALGQLRQWIAWVQLHIDLELVMAYLPSLIMMAVMVIT